MERVPKEIFSENWYGFRGDNSSFDNQYYDGIVESMLSYGTKYLDDFFGDVRGKALKGGYLIVLQTSGRNGQYNPHLHIISTSGRLDEKDDKWEHLDYLPYPMLYKKWQWHLLELLKVEIGIEEIRRLVDDCYKRYPREEENDRDEFDKRTVWFSTAALQLSLFGV